MKHDQKKINIHEDEEGTWRPLRLVWILHSLFLPCSSTFRLQPAKITTDDTKSNTTADQNLKKQRVNKEFE